MFLFNKSEKNDSPAPIQNKPVSQPTASTVKQPIDADDFFKDMGRKKAPPKAVNEIESPEITGLREAPPPRPDSTLPMIDSVSTDALRDKTLDVTEGLGNIKTVDVSKTDSELDEVLPDKTADPVHYIPFEIPDEEPAAVSDPLDPDSFFSNMGKRKKKPQAVIESPEITGLREAPEEIPESTLQGLDTDLLSTAALRDKTIEDNSFIHGDINEINTDTIDLSSLRD